MGIASYNAGHGRMRTRDTQSRAFPVVAMLPGRGTLPFPYKVSRVQADALAHATAARMRPGRRRGGA